MFRKNKVEEKPGFRKMIPEYSDNEIVKILKRRKEYQPEAVKLAVDEAIKRGIIYSEQDLFSTEYNELQVKKKIFNIPENELYRNKLRKSIIRMLYIVGIIPIVYGLIMQHNDKWAEGSIVSVFGLIWIVLVYFVGKNNDKRIVNALLVMSLLALLYIIYLFSGISQLKGLDIFITMVFFLLLFYGLFWIKKIL